MAATDKNFEKVVRALQKHGTTTSTALLNKGPMHPELLADPSNTGPKATDTAAIQKYFDRSAVEKQYTDTITHPSPSNGVNVAIASKLQSDFLAGLERDWRTQYGTSRIRSICMAAGRRVAQGDGEGPVNKGIVQAIKDYLQIR
jgi:hypothetical protein